MDRDTDFTLEHFWKTAKNLLYKNSNNNLQYWEKDLIECFWYKMTQKQIAKHLSSKAPYTISRK